MGKRRNRNKNRDECVVFNSGRSSKLDASESCATDASDTGSCVTHPTIDDDMQSVLSENNDEEEDVLITATFSDRLGELLDNATHKNISIRLNAMDNIRNLLTKRYVATDIEKWTETLLDLVDKALRKTDEEAERAALLAALISVQLGEKVSNEMEAIVSFMCQLSIDPARSVQLRTQILRSVTLCTLLSLENSSSFILSADSLRSIWFGTKSTAVSTALFCLALSGWSLLIHQGGRGTLNSALMDQSKLSAFVSSTQLEMRISAGEALAVLHEAAVLTYGIDYRFPNQEHLLSLFEALATDSLKYRSKKDRKVQRLTFRQICAAIKDRETPEVIVKFGTEVLFINSCGKKLFYEFACDVLHSDMNTHLKLNPVLRDWFDLGPVLEAPVAVLSKPQRVAIQNAINKTRDLQRSKQRNKRFAK